MNAWYHAVSSAKKFGGKPTDYLQIHEWFDASKAFMADPRHRAMRHHTAGIFECANYFGSVIVNSDGKPVPVRAVGEQHVLEDLGRIPTPQDWLECIAPRQWMNRVPVKSKTISLDVEADDTEK